MTWGRQANTWSALNLLLAGYVAFRADQNCPYDVAVDLHGQLVRLQVKSTRTAKPLPNRATHIPSYQWHVRRADKGGRRVYGAEEFDLLALVALDLRLIAYMPPSLTKQAINIRPPDTKAGRQFAEFPFAKAIHEIGVSR